MRHFTVVILLLISSISFSQTRNIGFPENGSGVEIGTLSKNEIKALTKLGQIWGFLKYHHPAVASGKYNWDSELFVMISKIQGAKNRSDQQAILLSWIDSLGPLSPQKSIVKHASNPVV